MANLGLPNPSGNLGENIFPFVGRQSELEKLRALFTDPEMRLVTVLGPGGIGKTSLAWELAADLRTGFEDGVVFVPLVQLSAPEEILPTLAGVLGLQLPLGGDLKQTICAHLASRQMLLVLDNFGHLTEGALLVHELLAAAPRLKVLVTSRQKLNLLGEVLFHLEGLDLPPDGMAVQVQDYDAVRLFAAKAKQARPDFELDTAMQPDVVEVCRMLAGVPLSILLAAAWVEHFSPAEIVAQIQQSLDFLTQDLQNLPPRHRSMRAVFDSTFDRLDGRQRAVFMRLAIFRGGFTLEAADVVAGADLPVLLALINYALLRRDPDSGRYDLHELLRQYAHEKLVAAGKLAETRAAYQTYFLDFLHQQEVRLKSTSQATALDEIAADFENIRLAWDLAVETCNFETIGNATPSLYAFCDMRSWFHAGEALFDRARQDLALLPGEKSHPVLGLVLLSWYDLRSYIEKIVALETYILQAKDCLAAAESANYIRGTAASLVWLGAIAEDQNDYAAAIRCYLRSIHVDSWLDDFYWVRMRIGLCQQAAGQYDTAIQSFEKCAQRGEEINERVKTGWAKLNIGDTLVMQGKPKDAVAYLDNARALFEEVGTLVGVVWAAYSLSKIALARGDRECARELAERALEIAGEIHSDAWCDKVNALLGEIGARSTGQAAQVLSDPLSERELEVLYLLKSDLSAPEIARRMIVSLNTIRYHTKSIYRKLQVNSRREAVRRAQELGL